MTGLKWLWVCTTPTPPIAVTAAIVNIQCERTWDSSGGGGRQGHCAERQAENCSPDHAGARCGLPEQALRSQVCLGNPQPHMRRIRPSDPAEMPFLDHLEELRWRIIYSLAAFVVGVLIGFFLVQH